MGCTKFRLAFDTTQARISGRVNDFALHEVFKVSGGPCFYQLDDGQDSLQNLLPILRMRQVMFPEANSLHALTTQVSVGSYVASLVTDKLGLPKRRSSFGNMLATRTAMPEATVDENR